MFPLAEQPYAKKEGLAPPRGCVLDHSWRTCAFPRRGGRAHSNNRIDEQRDRARGELLARGALTTVTFSWLRDQILMCHVISTGELPARAGDLGPQPAGDAHVPRRTRRRCAIPRAVLYQVGTLQTTTIDTSTHKSGGHRFAPLLVTFKLLSFSSHSSQ